MTYRDRLYSWCIVRLLPQLQRVTVSRFRSRSQAENHLRVLRRLMPAAAFAIVFDPPAPPLPNSQPHPAHAINPSNSPSTERVTPSAKAGTGNSA
ncbi:MAG: hypothetical protein KME20_03760 [Kaiparowitsia implicata GSE-PSE-MK54-09C]|jgi:hypothetical protein|nr:hypothetical protein [Kaiparowitsia implicata GSE-PSE-MK54-09C]